MLREVKRRNSLASTALMPACWPKISARSLLRLRATVGRRRRAAVEPHHGAISADQARAKIGIRLRRPKLLGGRDQRRANVARLERRVVLQQQRRDAADMGGGDRRSGGELDLVLGRQRDDLDARSGDREITAAIGAGE